MDKLSFKLPVFEGPLDLLLYLIQKNKLDIMDIPVSELVSQYIEHINYMKNIDMEIASEFLEMAARLVYIKTVSLLPKHEEAEKLKEELTGQLLEYKLCQEIATKLSGMSGGLDGIVRNPVKIEFDKEYKLVHKPDVLLPAYINAVGRGERRLPPPATAFSAIVKKRIVSISSKIVFVIRTLWHGKKIEFHSLFKGSKSKSDIVATFLAVLELMKAKRITVEQTENNISIKINKAGARVGNKQAEIHH
ncbi:MAG: serine protease [Clostridiales bacterium 43-6]|nr:MAG: serine protease [Clostridiales bacterium 43-6]